jgi:hypothetical protein
LNIREILFRNTPKRDLLDAVVQTVVLVDSVESFGETSLPELLAPVVVFHPRE